MTVAIPQTAPQAKVDATRGYGAEIVFAPDMTKLIALVGELKDRSGAYFLHPYDDAAMIAHKKTASEYVGEWRRDSLAVPTGPDEIRTAAEQEAQRLDGAFPRERLQRFVANGGWDPDRAEPRP